MKLFLIIILSIPTLALSSVSDFFGTSSSTMAVSGIGSSTPSEGGNNYYLPAIIAFSKNISAEYSIFTVRHKFPTISGIVTKNGTNNSDVPITDYGKVNTEYEDFTGHVINLILPLKLAGSGALGLSFSGPFKDLTESNSGHPYLPEYVMYRSRYRRTIMSVNYAHALTNQFALSFGVHMGYQVAADIESNMSLTGNDYGSSAYAKTKASPSFGAILSTVYKTKRHVSYFTYHQEMKSNFSSKAYGLTNNLAVAFNINLESMIYYDPHIFRIGYNYKVWRLELLSSLEYQMWGNYKTPTIRVKKNSGGIMSSDDYEKQLTKDIIIPKFGANYAITDQIKLSLGVGFRPTPLKGEFENSGNSIDCDKFIYSTGIHYSSKLFGKDTEFGLSGQFHDLKEKKITKTDNLENGDSGLKIGAPGYNIGGSVLTIALGAKIKL